MRHPPTPLRTAATHRLLNRRPRLQLSKRREPRFRGRPLPLGLEREESRPRSPSEMSLRPSEQAGLRRSSFKASVSAADGLRRRVSSMDGIRKEVRSSALRKRRCGGAEAAPDAHPLFRCGGAEAAPDAHPEAPKRTVGSASGFSRPFSVLRVGDLLVPFRFLNPFPHYPLV